LINNKTSLSKNSLDWRLELARIPPIITVVIVHMLLDSKWIGTDTMPHNFFLFVAMAVFFYVSGFVQGLKKEFTRRGDINKLSYFNYIKKRFIRLYSGYYIALGSVFVSRLIAYYTLNINYPNNPIDTFSAWSLFLDLSSLWPLLTTSGCGGIWPPGWFICSMFVLSLLYPFLRRIYSKSRKYIYLIISITTTLRILVALSPYANPAYFFPLSWLSEFSLGIIIGEWSSSTGDRPPLNKKYQTVIVKLANRVWPMYICHLIPIVWISMYAKFWECLLIFIIIFPLTEVYYRILKRVPPN
jgi:peptidoglycan/LPS O-acetylase OafA/YrhL